MKLRDIAIFRQQYQKTSSQTKSYYVCLWFLLIMALFHIILDIKSVLEIRLSYKWVIIAIFSLIGIATFNRRILRKVIMHIYFIFIVAFFIPYSFFNSGGQFSFVQYFMIVFLVMIFFLMEVKIASLYAIYCFIQLEILYIVENQNPHLIKHLNIDWFLLDSVVTIPILMIIMVALVTILLVLYKKDEEKIIAHNTRLKRDAKLKGTMLDITYSVTQGYDCEHLTQNILSKLIDAMESVEQGYLMKIVERKAYYDSAIGYDIDALREIVIPVEETYLYKATEGEMNRAVIISKSEQRKLDEEKGSAFEQVKVYYNRSTICAPIKLHDKIWGILNIESLEGQEFNKIDKEFIRVFTREIEKVLAFSELLDQNQRLRNYDYLTSIMNRFYFTKVISDKLLEMKEDDKIAFISFDIDNFKKINDQYGHRLGDDYLKYFVAIVKQHISDNDIFGRTGGDEFKVMLMNKTTFEASEIIDSIIEDLDKRPVILNKNRIVLRFSYGIVQCYHGENLNDIIIKSNQMLYKNKKNNKINTFNDQWTFNI